MREQRLRGVRDALLAAGPGDTVASVASNWGYVNFGMFARAYQQRFGELVTEWLDPALLQGEVVSDGPLAAAEMSMEVAQMLRDAGPWGQMFPEPLFDGRFRILQQRLVGERHLKVMVEPVGGGPLLDGIAFNVDTAIWPDPGVREVQLAYKLDINEFRGNRSLQLIIDHLWPN